MAAKVIDFGTAAYWSSQHSPLVLRGRQKEVQLGKPGLERLWTWRAVVRLWCIGAIWSKGPDTAQVEH